MHKCYRKECNNQTENPKYCSKSCAASCNNSKFPKRSPAVKNTCTCGKNIRKEARFCTECWQAFRLNTAMKTPVGELLVSSNPYSRIRTYARRIMDRYGPEKTCSVCGFDVVVEVAHVIPISEFNKDTPMGIVNDPKNLVYLCPNHHAMYELGLLEI